MSRSTILLDQADRDRLQAIAEYLAYTYGERSLGLGRLIRYAISVVYQMQKEGMIDSLKRIEALGASARKRGRPRRPLAPGAADALLRRCNPDASVGDQL